MQKELQGLQPVLAATQQEAEMMMVTINKDKQALAGTREEVHNTTKITSYPLCHPNPPRRSA